MSRGCITLLTDFGTTDPYVAAMKGAALSVNPAAQLVDISHEVAPHDVAEGGYVLAGSFRYFPQGTVHLAVVDPGVGSERRILAAEVDGHILVAPDNGLLDVALCGSSPRRLVHVKNAHYFRHPVSMTFHGRDIFAPVAAHLTLGVDLGEMGPQADDYQHLEAGTARASEEAVEGQVIHVDRFGNLVTNVSREHMAGLRGGQLAALRVEIAGQRLPRIHNTYAEVGVGELIAVVGSAGLLEVSANRGSAADLLGVGRRTPVRVVPPPGP
ncbi:MAG: S-adenosyl-l-methionine hydroxide adenosyltransferase family protein [Candidatus Brocadiia bacterium]